MRKALYSGHSPLTYVIGAHIIQLCKIISVVTWSGCRYMYGTQLWVFSPFYELGCKGVGDGCWIGSGPGGRSVRRGDSAVLHLMGDGLLAN